jgi:hypothetical protein
MTTQEILFDFCDQLLTQADHRMTKAEKLVSENNHEMAAQDATVSKLLLSLEMAVRETANSLFANMSQRFMEEIKPILKPIKCRDSATLSVQASKYHYSKPRDDKGPYTHVEVGFPSPQPADSWIPFADGTGHTDVYGYVPVELVHEYIDQHGGIDVGKSL